MAQWAADESTIPLRGPHRDGDVRTLDLRVALVPGATFVTPVIPDFTRAEAEPAVVSLESREVFFEARRPFFVEDADRLRFPLPPEATGRDALLYTRRIGRVPPTARDSPDGAADDAAGRADDPRRERAARAHPLRLVARPPGASRAGRSTMRAVRMKKKQSAVAMTAAVSSRRTWVMRWGGTVGGASRGLVRAGAGVGTLVGTLIGTPRRRGALGPEVAEDGVMQRPGCCLTRAAGRPVRAAAHATSRTWMSRTTRRLRWPVVIRTWSSTCW